MSDWDNYPVNQTLIDLCIFKAKEAVIFGGNYYQMAPSACWLIWDKVNGDSDFADCEIAWTNL